MKKERIRIINAPLASKRNNLLGTTFQISKFAKLSITVSRGIFKSGLYKKIKNTIVKQKLSNENRPTLKKYSVNPIPAAVTIKMLGIEEMEKIVPPIFTKIA